MTVDLKTCMHHRLLEEKLKFLLLTFHDFLSSVSCDYFNFLRKYGNAFYIFVKNCFSVGFLFALKAGVKLSTSIRVKSCKQRTDTSATIKYESHNLINLLLSVPEVQYTYKCVITKI